MQAAWRLGRAARWWGAPLWTLRDGRNAGSEMLVARHYGASLCKGVRHCALRLTMSLSTGMGCIESGRVAEERNAAPPPLWVAGELRRHSRCNLSGPLAVTSQGAARPQPTIGAATRGTAAVSYDSRQAPARRSAELAADGRSPRGTSLPLAQLPLFFEQSSAPPWPRVNYRAPDKCVRQCASLNPLPACLAAACALLKTAAQRVHSATC